jgi:hypothetical protein
MSGTPGLHEDYSGQVHTRGLSDRSFGLVLTGFFALVGVWPVIRHSGSPRGWACGLALVLAAIALLCAPVLRVPNRLWMRLGLLLSRVVNPIAMGVIFFGIFTPTAVFLRLRGRDPLRLRRDFARATYWIDRIPPGPEPRSMANQF